MIISWSRFDLRFPLNVCVHVDPVPVWRAFSFRVKKNGTYWRWTFPQVCLCEGPTSSLVLSALHIGLRHSSCSSCMFTSSAHSVSFATLLGLSWLQAVCSCLWMHPLISELIRAARAVALPSGVSASDFFSFLSFSASGFFFGIMCFRWSQSTC